MERLRALIESHEEWLMQRILDYALEYGYAQYTSTLQEPWRLSIYGLSDPLLAALRAGEADLELGPDEDYSQDAIASFGILEAQRYRERGIDLGMFLALFKYYRQSYKDLIAAAGFESEYEDESSVTQGLPKDALANVSLEWLAAFGEAIESLDLDAARMLIDQLGESDRSLATGLADLAASYRFDTLQSLVQEVGQ